MNPLAVVAVAGAGVVEVQIVGQFGHRFFGEFLGVRNDLGEGRVRGQFSPGSAVSNGPAQADRFSRQQRGDFLDAGRHDVRGGLSVVKELEEEQGCKSRGENRRFFNRR